MISLTVIPEDSALIELIASMQELGTEAAFPRTAQTLDALAGAVARSWRDKVKNGPAIQRHRLSPYEHIVYTEDRLISWLEHGLPGFDMKQTHTRGRKSRIVKPRYRKGKMIDSWTARRKNGQKYTVRAGDPYLIVPFRHKTQNARQTPEMNTLEQMYSQAKKQVSAPGFKRSIVLSSPEQALKTSPNYWREMIGRATYQWGSRLQFEQTPENSYLQGMVAMGPSRQSSFMTFRVVSVNSPQESWQHPGIEARHYLGNIMQNSEKTIIDKVESALKQDLS